MKTFTKRHDHSFVVVSTFALLAISITCRAQAPLSSQQRTVDIGEVSEFYIATWLGRSTPIDTTLQAESGTLLPKLSSDNTLVGGFAIGLGIAPNFRVEAELGSQRIQSQAQGIIQSGDAAGSGLRLRVNSDVHRFMLNGYFDLHISPRYAFYLMGGIGAALTNSELWRWQNASFEAISETEGTSSTHFAWQLGVGQSIFIGNHWVLEIGTRLFRADTITSEANMDNSLSELGINTPNFDFTTQEWLLGLRLRF